MTRTSCIGVELIVNVAVMSLVFSNYLGAPVWYVAFSILLPCRRASGNEFVFHRRASKSSHKLALTVSVSQLNLLNFKINFDLEIFYIGDK